MQYALRAVAILAAVSVVGTAVFVAMFARGGGLSELLTARALGVMTLLGWGISLTAGPVAAIDLWRLRERGRRAGILFFGTSVAYYAVALFVKTPDAPVVPILSAMAVFAAPLVLLLLTAAWFRQQAPATR